MKMKVMMMMIKDFLGLPCHSSWKPWNSSVQFNKSWKKMNGPLKVQVRFFRTKEELAGPTSREKTSVS